MSRKTNPPAQPAPNTTHTMHTMPIVTTVAMHLPPDAQRELVAATACWEETA